MKYISKIKKNKFSNFLFTILWLIYAHIPLNDAMTSVNWEYWTHPGKLPMGSTQKAKTSSPESGTLLVGFMAVYALWLLRAQFLKLWTIT